MKLFSELFLALFVALSFLLSSCSGNSEDAYTTADNDTLRNLTFVYIMAENSLSSYAASDIFEMKSAADEIPDDCELLLFVDDLSFPRICRIYFDGVEGQCETILTFEEDFSSSDINNVRMVFDWVNERYPARTLNVVMWSHGSGWVSGKSAPCQRSIGVDNGNNSFSNSTSAAIDIDELAVLLQEQPVKPTMLLFDACFMQTVETAYALRNSVDYIVASPAEIPADGAPYDLLVEHLFAKNFDARKIIDAYCSDYANKRDGVVLSMIDCSAMEQLAECSARYIPKAFERVKGDAKRGFSYLPNGYFIASRDYYPDFSDVNAVMKANLAADDYEQWYRVLMLAVPYRATTGSWYSAVHRTTYKVNNELFCGVSMYLPCEGEDNKAYNTDFSTTEWYTAAGWIGTGW